MEGGSEKEVPKDHVFLPAKLRLEQNRQGLCLSVEDVCYQEKAGRGRERKS